MIEISVTGNVAVLTTPPAELPVLTSGSQNVYTIDITTDDAWQGLTIKAVFVAAKPGCLRVSHRASDCIWGTEPINDGTATITESSAAVLKAGYTLYVGVTGSDGAVVRNSTFARIAEIAQGAEPISSGGNAPVGYWDLQRQVSQVEDQVDSLAHTRTICKISD